MILINKWYGRYGNNILQILNCLSLSEKENLKLLCVSHPLFSVSKEGNKKNITYSKNFKECFLGISDKYIYEKNITANVMKYLFKKYVNMNFVYQKEKKHDICFHIRSGDIMKNINRTHSTYVQPPFSFYQKIIEENKDKKICVIYEDTHNPVVKPLMERYDWVNFQSSSIQKDLETLACCETLIGSMGTFWLISFFMSECVKKIVYYENMPWLDTSDWGVESEKISFPNYIKVGEWKNSPEQRKLMLEYKY